MGVYNNCNYIYQIIYTYIIQNDEGAQSAKVQSVTHRWHHLDSVDLSTKTVVSKVNAWAF